MSPTLQALVEYSLCNRFKSSDAAAGLTDCWMTTFFCNTNLTWFSSGVVVVGRYIHCRLGLHLTAEHYCHTRETTFTCKTNDNFFHSLCYMLIALFQID